MSITSISSHTGQESQRLSLLSPFETLSIFFYLPSSRFVTIVVLNSRTTRVWRIIWKQRGLCLAEGEILPNSMKTLLYIYNWHMDYHQVQPDIHWIMPPSKTHQVFTGNYCYILELVPDMNMIWQESLCLQWWGPHLWILQSLSSPFQSLPRQFVLYILLLQLLYQGNLMRFGDCHWVIWSLITNTTSSTILCSKGQSRIYWFVLS